MKKWDKRNQKNSISINLYTKVYVMYLIKSHLDC